MSIEIYKDIGKTLALDNTIVKYGDGASKVFYTGFNVKLALINNIKTTVFTMQGEYISFSDPPVSDSIIILVGDNSLDFYLDASSINSSVETVYIDTTTDVYLLSHDLVNDTIGDLQLSLNNVDFYSCIQVTIGTDIPVYIKANLAAPEDEVITYAPRLLAVESTTPIDSDGNITISFTPLDSPGVEIYEDYI